VENAVKHGLLHKKTNCRLDIRLKYREKENVLDVEVEDNGVGRGKSEEIKNRRSKLFQSFATGANQQRLELLNYGRSLGIVCEIIDKLNESGESEGTLVRLRIPIEEEK
jgi:LytS/YehU family sensor histidine kinase